MQDGTVGARGLYLLRLDLQEQPLRRVHRRATWTGDLGYSVHAAMAGLWGDEAPRVFAVDRCGGGRGAVRVYAYSARGLRHLAERARAFARPEFFSLLRWGDASEKPMPESWRKGQAVRFKVRVCPTVRLASDGPTHRDGAEVDAYVVASWRAAEGEAVSREQVYRDWLAAALARTGAAQLTKADVEHTGLERVLRQTQGQGRQPHGLRKPDATIAATAKVGDGSAWADLLRRGVGRHKSFGFGMVLLEAPC